MNRLIFNLTVITSLTIIYSCKKENINPVNNQEISGVKIGEIKLSSAELAIIPYQVNDSITFKDSLGNVKTFVVESRQTHFKRFFKNGATDSTTNYYDIENLSVILSNNTGDFLNFDIDAPLPSYVSNNSINYNYFVVRCNFFGSRNLYSFPNYIDTMNFHYTLQGISIPYYPTITISSNSYNSVYELIDNNTYEKIYYNKTEGVVGFKPENNNVWYLDN